jgi:hypothetical protein
MENEEKNDFFDNVWGNNVSKAREMIRNNRRLVKSYFI